MQSSLRHYSLTVEGDAVTARHSHGYRAHRGAPSAAENRAE